MEEKILALYAWGMSQCEIVEQIKNFYNVDTSPEIAGIRSQSSGFTPSDYVHMPRF